MVQYPLSHAVRLMSAFLSAVVEPHLRTYGENMSPHVTILLCRLQSKCAQLCRTIQYQSRGLLVCYGCNPRFVRLELDTIYPRCPTAVQGV